MDGGHDLESGETGLLPSGLRSRDAAIDPEPALDQASPRCHHPCIHAETWDQFLTTRMSGIISGSHSKILLPIVWLFGVSLESSLSIIRQTDPPWETRLLGEGPILAFEK